MKIVIGNKYQNDEENNEKYTVDENGNINLFIDIENNTENDSTKSEGIKIDNIDNLQKDKEPKSCFVEFNEEDNRDEYVNLETEEELIFNEDKEDFIEEEKDYKKGQNNITVEKKLGNKFEEFYNSIYSERENNLEEKYSDIDEKIINQNKFDDEEKLFNEKKENINNGQINILCKLDSKDGVEIKGARVNLYLLNGVSPKLCDSKFTDGSGRIIFNNLQNGCYRIISIVDRRYFEKPVYYNWNEVTIDKNNNKANIVIVNKLKAGYYRRQY